MLLEKALIGSHKFKGVEKWAPALDGDVGQVHITEDHMRWEMLLWPSLKNRVSHSGGIRIKTLAV